MKKHIIFDMDGVIVDSEPLYARHIHEFLISLGVDDPSKLKSNIKGRNSQDMWQIYIDEFQLDYTVDDIKEEARQAYIDYLNLLPNIPEIPGAVELIKYCHKKGYRLALASSAGPKRIELFLEKLKIKHYFEVILNGDSVEHSKPAPDIFLLAAEKLGGAPSDCIVVEDAENGVRAAKAAGMKCIAYYGSDHNTDDLLAADLVVNDFHALIQGLKTGELPV